MASSIGRLTKASIIKESTWGTQGVPTLGLSAKAISLVNKPDLQEDPRNIGQLFTADYVKTAEKPSGNLDLTSHPEELAIFLNAALGKNDAPTAAPKCYLQVSYVGTDAYADLVMATGTLTGASGANLAGKVTAFALDTSQTANNTPTKLATLINAVTGWKAYVFGDGSVASSGIADFTLVVVNQSGQLASKIMPIVSGSSTAKVHHIYPGTATDSWPSFTIAVDKTLGSSQAVFYTGFKPDSVNLKLTAGAIAELNVTGSAKAEITGQSYPAVSPAIDTAYVSGRARFIFNGYEGGLAKEITLAIAPNMDKSIAVGSLNIMEQIPTGATCKVTGSLNLDATDYLKKYPDYVAGTAEEIVIYMENSGWADQANDARYSALFVVNSFKFNKYESTISGPGRLTVSFEATTVYKGATVNHIDCYVIDTNTSSL